MIMLQTSTKFDIMSLYNLYANLQQHGPKVTKQAQGTPFDNQGLVLGSSESMKNNSPNLIAHHSLIPYHFAY